MKLKKIKSLLLVVVLILSLLIPNKKIDASYQGKQIIVYYFDMNGNIYLDKSGSQITTFADLKDDILSNEGTTIDGTNYYFPDVNISSLYIVLLPLDFVMYFKSPSDDLFDYVPIYLKLYFDISISGSLIEEIYFSEFYYYFYNYYYYNKTYVESYIDIGSNKTSLFNGDYYFTNENNYQNGYDAGYIVGNSYGYDNGYDVGFDYGYELGLEKGYADGLIADDGGKLSIVSFIPSMLTAIGGYFLTLGQISLFGISLNSLLAGLLSILLIIFIIKFFISR